MSVYDLASLFDIAKLKRTELLGDLKASISAYFEAPEQIPGSDIELPPDCNESFGVDWWQHYGFASRPVAGSESLIVKIGSEAYAIASRTLAAVKAYGQLGEGDVALYSVGKNLLKLAKEGSMTILVPAPGDKQIVIHISSKDGSIKGIVPPGLTFEISPKNGICFNAGDKDITLAGKNIQFIGSACNINTGSVKLGLTGARPLGWCTAGVAGAFASVPTPNIFV